MSAKADDQSGQMRQWATRAGNGRPNDLRFHHRRRRLGRLGAGQPAVGQEQQPGAAAGGRAGHAARQGAARDARQLSRHRLLRPALSLDRAAGCAPRSSPHNNPQESPPPLRNYEQARVLGGGSSINGQLANRGAPTDYDEWACARRARLELGRTCCPTSRRSSATWTSTVRWHGKEGRIPVRRIFPDLWTGHAKAAAEAFKAAGYEYLPDQNGEFARRLFPDHHLQRLRAARVGGDRLSRSRHAHAREPDDLDRHAGVSELLFEGRRCVGVRRAVEGRAHRVPRQGGHPVLRRDPFAGAPAARRHRPGRRTCASSASRSAPPPPGVGQRLMDHPSISVSAYVKPHARMNDYTRRHIHVGLRYSSELDGMPPGDMFVVTIPSRPGTRSASRSARS